MFVCPSVGNGVSGSVQDSDWSLLWRRHAAAGVQVSLTGPCKSKEQFTHESSPPRWWKVSLSTKHFSSFTAKQHCSSWTSLVLRKKKMAPCSLLIWKSLNARARTPRWDVMQVWEYQVCTLWSHRTILFNIMYQPQTAYALLAYWAFWLKKCVYNVFSINFGSWSFWRHSWIAFLTG